jgi:radical SAM superfamily enzyme YgiQ (UPF0313 family)
LSIVLINLESGWFNKVKPVNLNLGLLGIASYLKNHGYVVSLLDMLDKDFEYRFEYEVSNAKYVVLNVDIQSVAIYLEVLKAVRNSNPLTKILVGSFSRNMFGRFVNMFPHLANEPKQVDLIVYSSAELIEVLTSEKPSALELMDCDYSLVDIEKNYLVRKGSEVSTDFKDKKVVPIVTGEGCPYSCNFCANSEGNSYVKRPIADILEDIQQVEKYRPDLIWFQDDNIFLDKERSFKLLDYLKHKNFRWSAQTRLEYFNIGYLDYNYYVDVMSKNLSWLGVGFEHFRDSLRIGLGKKKVSEQMLTDLFNVNTRCDAVLGVAFMVGFPGEVFTDMVYNVQKILDFKKRYGDQFSITYQRFRPYPTLKMLEAYDYPTPSSIQMFLDTDYLNNINLFPWLGDEEKQLIPYLHKLISAANFKQNFNPVKKLASNILLRLGEYRIKNNYWGNMFENRWIN